MRQSRWLRRGNTYGMNEERLEFAEGEGRAASAVDNLRHRHAAGRIGRRGREIWVGSDLRAREVVVHWGVHRVPCVPRAGGETSRVSDEASGTEQKSDSTFERIKFRCS